MTESTHRLSERNCVDLVMKLINTNKITLLNTLSGIREYVTPEQLEKEIILKLESNGGRISFEELEVIIYFIENRNY